MKWLHLTLMSFLVVLYSCDLTEEGIPEDIEEETEEDSVPAPEGWIYYDGDEFNSEAPSAAHWALYGTSGIGFAKYGQGNQQMIQTYRPEQVIMQTLSTGEEVCTIISERADDAPAPMEPSDDKPGWWSGALSSRDAEHFYPLYSRIEVKARVPNEIGIWHAFWLRFYKGASTAELDMQEFFVLEEGRDTVKQTGHFYDSDQEKTAVNVTRGSFEVKSPAENFHVYGVQVDPDPDMENEAVISFLLDGEVTHTFRTGDFPGKYNKFILDALEEDRLDEAWDVAITGQVGGKWVGFPAEDLTRVETDIDWVRCFVRDE